MALADAPIGIVPIIFANDDLPELTPPIEPETLVAEIARLGFAGCQLSRALPRVRAPAGPATSRPAHRRSLRGVAVYLRGPAPDARDQAFDAPRRPASDSDGDVLIFSYHLSEERVTWSGRADQPGVPSLTEEGRARALALIHEVARAAQASGHPLVYHPHTGTFVETPAEVEWLMQSTDADLVGLCLDVGSLHRGRWRSGRRGSAIRPPHPSCPHEGRRPSAFSSSCARRAIPGFLDALRRASSPSSERRPRCAGRRPRACAARLPRLADVRTRHDLATARRERRDQPRHPRTGDSLDRHAAGLAAEQQVSSRPACDARCGPAAD